MLIFLKTYGYQKAEVRITHNSSKSKTVHSSNYITLSHYAFKANPQLEYRYTDICDGFGKCGRKLDRG